MEMETDILILMCSFEHVLQYIFLLFMNCPFNVWSVSLCDIHIILKKHSCVIKLNVSSLQIIARPLRLPQDKPSFLKTINATEM